MKTHSLDVQSVCALPPVKSTAVRSLGLKLHMVHG
eukprot:CAMPEP_0181339566 /NCGR_PEP_ID=MMETSP1101-20121128/29333_1 /TAXON_ID=46948 /ORGANISM="Rhodomonas abbreviata, Strain Caron Lab Isolate" /LENGTH=34 /DNA_ID= /DNA_START= /DNA_END= /DNA_ORIENTATION=